MLNVIMLYTTLSQFPGEGAWKIQLNKEINSKGLSIFAGTPLDNCFLCFSISTVYLFLCILLTQLYSARNKIAIRLKGYPTLVVICYLAQAIVEPLVTEWQ